ncbi:PucR family transcriptional regulator [Nocardioides sp. GCM10028917]|uniref:PucR family transcriptional regulator n=1 Tax=Nocardioides sp. GCM10028917 TaxID=3273408 RepID=UPI003612B01E
MQDELDRLAALLGRSVSVDSPTGRLLGYSVQSDDADGARILAILARQVPEPVQLWQDEHGLSTATGPVRLPKNDELKMTARLCVPLRRDGVLRAYLWIVEGPTQLTPEQVGAALEYGDKVLDKLAENPAQVGTRSLPELFHDLVAPALGAEAEQLVSAVIDVAPHLLGVSVRLLVGTPMASAGVHGPLTSGDVSRVSRRLGSADPRVLASSVTPTRTVLLLRDTHWRPAPGQSAVLPSGLFATGAGPVVSFDAAGLLHGLAMATFTATCVAADPRLPRDLAWEQLGMYRLLAQGEHDAWLEMLSQLADQGEPGDVFLDTLETYLDLAGDAQRTAAELGLHRTTLYYRLNRAATQLNGNLSDGIWRTNLHIALKARRLDRATEG